MNTNNSMSRTGAVLLRKGATLMHVTSGALIIISIDTPTRMGVHPRTHETVYHVNGDVYFNESYTRRQLEAEND